MKVKRSQRLLTLCLALAMCLALLPGGAGAVDSGYCGGEGDGTNLTWTLDSDGVLTISGTGAMADYDYDGGQPWAYAQTSLTLVKIDHGVTSIGDRAFYFFFKLTSVAIPDSVTSIGDCAFYFCSHLQEISVAEDNPAYCSRDGVLYSKDLSTIVAYPTGKGEPSYDIPDSVTIIENGAFAGCVLKSVTIPEGLITIGSSSFISSENLTVLSISGSVTSIGDQAFYNCGSLTDIYYGGSISDWKKVQIGFLNDSILYSDIYFCDPASESDEFDPGSNQMDTYSGREDAVVITEETNGEYVVQLENCSGHDYTFSLDFPTLEQFYPVNVPETDESQLEYYWGFHFTDGHKDFAVATTYFHHGDPNQLTLYEMQSNLWEINDHRARAIGEASLGIEGTTLKWTFTVPNNFDTSEFRVKETRIRTLDYYYSSSAPYRSPDNKLADSETVETTLASATITPEATIGGQTVTMTASGVMDRFTNFDIGAIFDMPGYFGFTYALWFDGLNGTFSFDKDVTLSHTYFDATFSDIGTDEVFVPAGEVMRISDGVYSEVNGATVPWSEFAVTLDDGNTLMIVDASQPENYASTPPDTPLSAFPGTITWGTNNAAASETETAPLPTAARYVPYSTAIPRAEAGSRFILSVGSLPAGIAIESGGLISGIPTEVGVFDFQVTETYSEGSIVHDCQISVFTQYSVDVETFNEPGYGFVETISDNGRVQDQTVFSREELTDQVMHLEGAFSEFQNLYLDAQILTQNVDYTAEEGSTKITIAAETIGDAGGGTHTVAAEFVTAGGRTVYTVQNYTVAGIASREVRVTVEGQAVLWTDAEPYIDTNNRTMTPLRAVGEALGLSAVWDNENRELSFTDGAKTIYFPVDTPEARTSDGSTVTMDTSAVMVNGRTYAPVRYLAEFFGRSVSWDSKTRTAAISKDEAEALDLNPGEQPSVQPSKTAPDTRETSENSRSPLIWIGAGILLLALAFLGGWIVKKKNKSK